MNELTVYIDGGCKSNGSTHPKCYGSYKIEYGVITSYSQKFDLPLCRTNNEAEYGALYEFLNGNRRLLTEYKIYICTDSLLIVNQLIGDWKITSGNLLSWRNACMALMEGTKCSIHKVDRSIIVDKLGH